jgi:putative addiction module killer protein
MAILQILEYVTQQGDCPIHEWLSGLDKPIQARALARLRRFPQGNFGQNRHLGGGLCEAKMDFGPGYRVYYGIFGKTLVILLCGGDKGSQHKDIERARNYWAEYLEGQS